MKKYLIPLITIALSIGLSLTFYPLLPDRMASHWNIYGQVDGYSSRLFNILFLPTLLILMFASFVIIPKIDPKRENIKKFEQTFNVFINAMLFFVIALQLQVFLWNTYIQIPFGIFMPILFGILVFFVGDLVTKAEQNYTIGIRTPWTLESKKVWDKTHKLGGILFKISAILITLSALTPKYSFYVLIGSILLIVAFLLIYSYLEYKKEK